MDSQLDHLQDSRQTRSEACAVCQRPNEQILLLTCSHDPCIECAALHYFEGAMIQSDFQLAEKSIYWCQVCYEPTPIDSESIEQLNLFMKKRLRDRRGKNDNFTLTRSKSLRQHRKSTRKHSMSKEKSNEDFIPISMKASYPTRRTELQAPQLLKFARSQDLLRSSEYCVSETPTEEKLQEVRGTKKMNSILKYASVCPQHEDQFQMYYCFTCLASICVECALHGSHVGHEVESIKKAGPKLKGIYQSVLNDALRYRGSIEQQIKGLNTSAEQFLAWSQRQQGKIKQRFAEMFNILKAKQNSLLEELLEAQAEGMKKLRAEKQLYDKILSEMKCLTKDFKRSLGVDYKMWDVTELEALKALIANFTQSKLKKVENRNPNLELKYLHADLVMEGVDMIQELVCSFKLSSKSSSMSLK